jgi:hypothetical protein
MWKWEVEVGSAPSDTNDAKCWQDADLEACHNANIVLTLHAPEMRPSVWSSTTCIPSKHPRLYSQAVFAICFVQNICEHCHADARASGAGSVA